MVVVQEAGVDPAGVLKAEVEPPSGVIVLVYW